MIKRSLNALWAVAIAWAFVSSAFLYAWTKNAPYFFETFVAFGLVCGGPLALVAVVHYIIQPSDY